MTEKYPEQESSTLEFKEKAPEVSKLLKEIIAFCNLYGGQIILGIKDDGTVAGLEDSEIQAILEYLGNAVYEGCTPPIIPHIYPRQLYGKTVLVIEISEGMNKPYFLTHTGLNAGTFIRLGRSCVKATAQMIAELQWQSRGHSCDEILIYKARKNDIDLDKFKHFLAHRRGSKHTKKKLGPIDALLHSYGALAKEQGREYPTLAGIACFGKEPQKFLHECILVCSRFKGNSGRDAIESIQCEGDLFKQFDSAFEFIVKHIPRTFKIREKKRTETPIISEIVIREVLVNLLAHRHYGIQSSGKIAIYNNRIEVFSPGVFPGPLNQKNLEFGISYIRNVYISKVLYEAGYMEKLGSGLTIIFEYCRRDGLQIPKVVEGEGFVKYILSLEKNQNEDDTSKEPHERVLEMLNWSDAIRVTDVQSYLRISRATAARYLSALVKEKKLKRTGSGPMVRYVSS